MARIVIGKIQLKRIEINEEVQVLRKLKVMHVMVADFTCTNALCNASALLGSFYMLAFESFFPMNCSPLQICKLSSFPHKRLVPAGHTLRAGLPDFSWCKIPKIVGKCQMTTKYNKQP
jgi:hypothetical protein